MLPLSSIARPAASLVAVVLLTLAAGCSKPASQSSASSAPSSSVQTESVPHVKAASKLGDLSAFRGIANDVSAGVNRGDLVAAKNRVKDLEVSWDSAEAGLKPRAADDWHLLDKEIDKVLTALRMDAPRQSDCKAATDSLLRTFDQLQGSI